MADRNGGFTVLLAGDDARVLTQLRTKMVPYMGKMTAVQIVRMALRKLAEQDHPLSHSEKN